mmetsp:Transcript_9361/g.29842  ORF Transcript_9361/g.29842 Transcript_9361/m.29842 type:complete len:436 (-) Transcript_9361:520-1827(-)
MAGGPSMLLTCDVKGVSKSCALHKLRWKSTALAGEGSSSEGQGEGSSPTAKEEDGKKEERSLKRAKSSEGSSVGIEAYGAVQVGRRDSSNGSSSSARSGFGKLGGLMRRSSSGASSTGEGGGEWGFYEDCDSFFSRESASRLDLGSESLDRVTPEYVLEDSLASQALWHSTAGKRPPQPIAERKKFEALWAKNFEESEVDYAEFDAVDRLERPPWARLAETSHVIPLLREQSPFGTSATKSWECPTCGELSSMMVHIPKYQVVKEGAFDVHAEYLVVVRLRFVTFGLWRRFRDFERLADKIVGENRPVDFENTLGSWRCVKRRQKWFRCLDKDYITLKCFLLERFLHDAVFESTSSDLFLDFLEIQIPDDDDAAAAAVGAHQRLPSYDRAAPRPKYAAPDDRRGPAATSASASKTPPPADDDHHASRPASRPRTA